MDEQTCDNQMSREQLIQNKVDENGARWRKVYFGGGMHFENWLAQAKELGEVQVEQVIPDGLACFGNSGEKLFRIWVKEEPTPDII
ncbi:MAG: hypothetical protein HN837_00830 [Chloroflexi bacterium]|nr:hypothetical protein [Chloroflexota bacterium]